MAVRRSVPKGDEVTCAIRAELQRVDRELVEALAERLELVQRLWAYKGTVGLPLEDRDQEGRVLARARRTAERRGLKPAFVDEVFRAVIAEGKRTATPGSFPPVRPRSPAQRSRSRRRA
jgi:chorismate mutase / prephenate dehydrogenase